MKVWKWVQKLEHSSERKSTRIDVENTDNSGRIWGYEVFSVFSVCYSCISCGNFLGYTSTAVPSMQMDHIRFSKLSSNDISLIGGLGPLGALFGSLCTLLPLRYFGPRRTIGLFGIPVILASWIIIGLCNGNIIYIYLARVIGGIGCGVVISCAPLYVMDVSSLLRRGQLGIMPQFLMIFGILLSYILGSVLNWKNLARASALITIPSGILIFFAPDSPRWLLGLGNSGKALLVLEKLNGKKKAGEILQEIQTNMQNNQNSRGTRWNLGTFKAVLVALGIISIQQLTGINGVTFFALSIFNQSSSPNISSSSSTHHDGNIPSIILASTQLVASFTSTFFVERFGRKFLLTISSISTTLAAVSLGLYFYFYTTVPYLFEYFYWIPLFALIVFAFGFAIGLGPITWILVAEILPQDTRHLMNPLVIAYNWFCVFIVTSSFPWLWQRIHFYGIFWLYAAVGFIGLIFIRIFIPETKGKSQFEIQAGFCTKKINTAQPVTESA